MSDISTMDSRRAATLALFEPISDEARIGLGQLRDNEIQMSIAISLKRIADAICPAVDYSFNCPAIRTRSQ